jgi:hypothetical protein
MKERLLLFIQHVTGGRMTEFADLMGWSPQYLNRLTSVGSIGLRPIIALLEKFPNLNARWLILGEGVMLESGSDVVKARLLRLLALEKYMPVMNEQELTEFSNGRDDFPSDTIERWEGLLKELNEQNKSRVTAAMERAIIK